jgi:glutamyl-tRNA synthetase
MVHQRNGILPHALLNFVARIGWSHGNDELFTREQLIEYFDLKDVGRTNGVWNPEKLVSVNQHWIKNGKPEELAAMTVPFLASLGVTVANDARLQLGVKAFSTRAKTLVEMAANLKPYYVRGATMDAAAVTKFLDAAGKDMVRRARAKLEAIAEWKAPALDPIIDQIAAETGAKKGAIAQPIRVAVTGGAFSPGIGDTLELLGREETFFRIDAALA